ncbi:MAG TPA: NAD(P) transhydrogenase subunit alpha [Pyrinomonadaceae bacterium]|jgi:NAD(P) transhydrogenase subunit alpha|nr:NAD(P) transhydrogenase subunit alpha [Pyrinomonadaceae bacterium]
MDLAILLASDTSFTAETLIPALYVFALAAFLGYQVISRVPPLLHTPLMSATNAISGISLVGSIVTAGAQYNRISTILGFTAVTCATINVVGGFMITDRMLRMFKRKVVPAKEVKELAAKDGEKEKR